MAQPHSTLLYYGFTSLCLTLRYSTFIYISLAWLEIYFTVLDSTSLYIGSTSLYLTLHYSLMAVLDSTIIYYGFNSFYLTLLYPLL